ncbi:MAG: aminotransferase class I/II-fold pyridoxal phosphate-dependent enzyme [Defluviitaleaceae bacterium]|nr:aminotransferase class I/II-fold pyridoxal phosphate-dependent enzyme [Defluviitaleaceae bacterium]
MYEHIKAYLDKDIYPFHMPGHKRNPLFLPPDLPSLDLTEIPGMDVLNEPTGLLADMQANLAAFFGADESFLLVNGSSAGIVAAICATCSEGNVLFAARNGHASMYNGMVLAGATPRYFYPTMRFDGLFGRVDPNIFDEMPQGAAAFIVSPTYEGFTSDIAAIAKRVHDKNGILIVDEAHGAHFPFHEAFPPPAITLGADIAINSLHKTLPVLGQTAVLHVKNNRVDRARLRFYLNAVQTTSPSYILMGAADYALKMLWKNPNLFGDYVKRLCHLREALGEHEVPDGHKVPDEHKVPNEHEITDERTCPPLEDKLIKLLPCTQGDDPSKLLFEIKCKPDEPTPFDFALQVSKTLADEYKIQPEMAWGNHLLAMTSVADTEEGFTRLINAVRGINERVNREWGREVLTGASSRVFRTPAGRPDADASPDCVGCMLAHHPRAIFSRIRRTSDARTFSTPLPELPEAIFTPRAALQHPSESIPASEAHGRISAELIAPCPPGIALIAPGERIPERLQLQRKYIRVIIEN